MSRRSRSARISADLELNRIQVTLSRFGEPVVELSGTIAAPNRRAASASSFTIRTAWLGPAGEAWIDEMKAAFERAASSGAERKEPE